MKGTIRKILPAGTIAGLLALTPLVAFAGSNGQQLEIESRYCFSATVYGDNQDGHYTQLNNVQLPNFDTYLANYWWIGEVAFDCYDENNQKAGTTTTEVPTNDPNSDYWKVVIEPNYGSNTSQQTNLLLHMGSYLSAK